jgi:hypothetical protein
VVRPSALEIVAGDFALAGGMAVSPSASWPGPCMQRRPFHGPPPALTSTDPDTSGRAVEYRQMMRRVLDSPITGTGKTHISPLQRVTVGARCLRIVYCPRRSPGPRTEGGVRRYFGVGAR